MNITHMIKQGSTALVVDGLGSSRTQQQDIYDLGNLSPAKIMIKNL